MWTWGYISYTTKLITLYLFRLSPAESSLIDQIGKLLLHELIDQGDSFLEAFLVRARDVKIKRRVLGDASRMSDFHGS